LFNLPKGKQPITPKWVYKVKVGSTRKPAKLKVRLIAYGFQQIEGLDYDEIFALVIKRGTIRTIIALATHKGWEVN
jgi:expansin (peptidoglycan-binding protein)